MHPNRWLEISKILTAEADAANEEEKDESKAVLKRRTAENVKDKCRELGLDNMSKRARGPWTIEEAIKLLRIISAATGV